MFFSGRNGVVYDTTLILNNSYPTTSTVFAKYWGDFLAKSRGSTLNAILMLYCVKNVRSLLTLQGKHLSL